MEAREEVGDPGGLARAGEGLGPDMDLHTQLSPELSPEDHMLGIDNVGLDFAELDLIINGENICQDICLPDSPPDSDCLTSPQYEGYDSAVYPGEVMGREDPPLYSHFAVRHPSLHDRMPELHSVDYSQPHQLVAEARLGGRGRVQASSVPTRLTVRGVSNNNQVAGRQTALCPRDPQVPLVVQQEGLDSIKQEPLPSPQAAPAPCPGPPVKRRRGEDQRPACAEELAAMKTEGEPEGAQQMVQFVAFQPGKWSQTFGTNRIKMPTPLLKVSVDKGFNFSSLDDAFIAQKKNHFQLTCHVVKEGGHELVSTEAGFRPIEHLQLNFYGVKSEAPEQRIQVEQSQTDRSRKRFFPIKLAFRGDQPMRVSIGRLHFSETTLNNMRKKGRPNPEQRFFQLVVALEAVVLGPNGAKVEVPLFCLATERIIVRASNPGLFEPEQEASWSKQGNSDTVYHMGKVGIGTDNSAEALTVQGNIQVTGDVLHPSDRRIKTSIAPVAGGQQLKNIQNVQVVEYQYKPEYLARFPTGEREKMEKRQTGVIAQDLKHIIPDAVESAGDVPLPGVGQLEDMLIVNKDRLFLENVGAVRELSKVTDNLGHRIEELESHTVRMTRLTSLGSAKSSGSLSTTSSHPRGKRGARDGSVFRSRWVQGSILALVAVMALCLVAMATLYILQFVQKDPEFPLLPKNISLPTALPSLPAGPTTRRPVTMGRLTTTVGPARLVTTAKPRLVTTVAPVRSTTTARAARTFPAIGKPHDCNAPDAERPCETFCCALPPLPAHHGPPPAPDYPDQGVTGPQQTFDDNTISSPGPQAALQEETSERDLTASNLVGGEEGEEGEEGLVAAGGDETERAGGEGRGGADGSDVSRFTGLGAGGISSFITDPKQGELGGLGERGRVVPPQERVPRLDGQQPRNGRVENAETPGGAKQEPGRSNQIEREEGKPAKDEELGGNFTTEEGGRGGAQGGGGAQGRKSSKSVASSLSNNVLSGAEKGRRTGESSQKGRRRRSAEDQEDITGGNRAFDFRGRGAEEEDGCGRGPELQVDTAVGRTDLGLAYCTGCSSPQAHNCSYRLPLSAHLPDLAIQLLLPAAAVPCPAASPLPASFCPAVNEIGGSEEVGGGHGPPRPALPPGLRAEAVEVRTHAAAQLTYRLPGPAGQGGQGICSLQAADLGKAFTQINVEVIRICGD